jgi:hypothetical protein
MRYTPSGQPGSGLAAEGQVMSDTGWLILVGLLSTIPVVSVAIGLVCWLWFMSW